MGKEMNMNKNKTDREKIPLSSRLRGIYMENFQSIKQPTYIEMNGLTFLYGPNSAGKSAIIDALKLWKLTVGAEKSEFNDMYLWDRLKYEQTKLGISFISRTLNESDGTDVAKWLEEEILYDQPHVEFMRNTSGQIIQVEYAGSLKTLKVAIDNQPLFEVHTFESIDFNADLSIAVSADQREDADANDRSLMGRLVIHKSNPKTKDLLDSIWSLIDFINKKKDLGLEHKNKSLLANFLDSSATNLIVKEEVDRYEIRGIFLDLYGGRHSRIAVCLYGGINKLLGSNKSDLEIKESLIRSALHDRLEDIANEINLMIAGICFQIRDLMSYSHVSGDRQTLSLKRPVYISPDLKFLNIENAEMVHPSVGQYAKSLAENSRQRRVDNSADDFVKYSISNLLGSLKGYKLKVSSLKVTNPAETRVSSFHREISEGLIVRMKIQTPSGKMLGLDEVGSGISYILPILTSLWATDTSFFEQPELHLHPAAQCEVGDVLIAAVSRGKNCIVESHSEHVLLRVLRRIRETYSGKDIPNELKLNSDQVSIYYFHPNGKGSTQVLKIRIDKQGEMLTEWPGGFFSERDRELFA